MNCTKQLWISAQSKPDLHKAAVDNSAQSNAQSNAVFAQSKLGGVGGVLSESSSLRSKAKEIKSFSGILRARERFGFCTKQRPKQCTKQTSALSKTAQSKPRMLHSLPHSLELARGRSRNPEIGNQTMKPPEATALSSKPPTKFAIP
jgi:hypothetical protein